MSTGESVDFDKQQRDAGSLTLALVLALALYCFFSFFSLWHVRDMSFISTSRDHTLLVMSFDKHTLVQPS